MADFLSTGVSGLLAFQRAIETTSHNISNVATEGYSRQRVDLTTRPAFPLGSSWLGSGVQVAGVQRIYDDLLAQQSRTASSGFQRFDAFAAQTERVNNLFSNTDTGLSATLQKFTNALQEVASSPSSTASRQVLLSEAGNLTERLRSYDSQLNQIDQEVEARLASEASEVSSLAAGIAQLNKDISAGLSRTGQPPNDLLDQRDRLLDELSNHLDISTVKQGDGRLNVFVGSGQPLVLGDNAAKLVPVANDYDPRRHGIGLQLSGGAVLDITPNLSGGSMGGVLDFREQVLDPTRNSLGRIAVGLADVVNAQHREGMDLGGALGQDLFAVGGVETLRNTNNPSAATVSVSRTSIGQLTESDYSLELTSGGWQMRRDDTGATVALTGTGTVADPLIGGGLSIVVSGTAQTGDRFAIQPTRGAVSGLNVLIGDPARIAAAAPIRTASNLANGGTGTISSGEVLDPTNAQLRSTVTITFPTAGTYSVNGGAAVAYTSGANIDVNGWRVAITGEPAAGDSFTVANNAGGAGDNRNALAIADALKRPVLDNATVSLDSATSQLTGTIGVATRQAQSSRDAQEVVRTEANSARDSVSGVNLDEEAANLIRYQQAYQAAAQVIRTASTLFDTLLAATR